MALTWQDVIFNRPAFYVAFGAISVAAVACLVYGTCNFKYPPIHEVVLYDPGPKATFPIDLWVTDEFEAWQVESIDLQIARWRKATKDQAIFVLHPGWHPDFPFSEDSYIAFGKKTMWRKSTTDPVVAPLVVRHGFFDGIAKGNFIVVIDDPPNSKAVFENIVAHELGHMMGLQHLSDDHMGLMHKGGGQNNITNWDVYQFQYLYGLIPASQIME